MLLGNYTPLSANPGRCTTHAIPNPYKWRSSGNMYSFYTGDHVVTGETAKSSFNNGYIPPYSWVLSPKAGGLSSVNEINGDGDLSITSLSLGKALASDMAGSGTISAAGLSLVTSMAAAIAGSGTLSASMVGIINMASTLAGSGNLTAAMGALAFCVATLDGAGSLTADIRGKLFMAANIYVNQSQAEVEDFWNATAALNNNPGTMGEKLNDAGSASNPWADTSSYGAGTKGALLEQIADDSDTAANK
jgi:hypothetical protein